MSKRKLTDIERVIMTYEAYRIAYDQAVQEIVMNPLCQAKPESAMAVRRLHQKIKVLREKFMPAEYLAKGG